MGDETFETGQVTTYTYDMNGQNISITHPDGTVVPVKATGSYHKYPYLKWQNIRSTFTYDEHGQVMKEVRFTESDLNPGTTEEFIWTDKGWKVSPDDGQKDAE